VNIGLWRDERHNYFARYADREAGPLPGVTGAIGIMDKPAIVGWAKNEVAKAAVDNMAMVGEMLTKGGRDATVSWLAGIPGYQRDAAADTGSLVHILSEKIARQQEAEIPAALEPYAAAFRSFLADRAPELVSLEQQVGNLTDGYGGTFDILARLDGVLTLIDVKTWRKRPLPGGDMYAETAMQLAAYGHAEFIGSLGDPKRHRMPRPDAYAVLHLRPDQYEAGYQVYPYTVTDAEYAAFLATLTLTKWKRERARLVIGDPAVGKKEAAA
jgi:hypothetical protein